MSHLAFDVSAAGAPRAAGVPMPPGLAALSIPERMAEVIRARRLQGCPTTERDFLEAVETCDLSVAELHAAWDAARAAATQKVGPVKAKLQASAADLVRRMANVTAAGA